MYSVNFYKSRKNHKWYWEILFRKKKVMSKGVIGYNKKSDAERSFWKIMSNDVCQQIEDNYCN